jgi:TonB family protein
LISAWIPVGRSSADGYDIMATLLLKKSDAPLAYAPMRALTFCLISFSSIVDLAFAQVTEVPSARTAELPALRPILVGHGPNSLIDRIDGQALVAKGQKDALIMFVCAVRKTGDIEWSEFFGGTSDSRALQEELAKRLSPASEVRFVPAVYNHRPVDAIYYGTVKFAVVNGKPRLRIFSNQERAELEAEHDFIGPQPFFGAESKFTGFHYPDQATPVTVDGFVHVALRIDVDGNLQDAQVASEQPPLVGFGDAALADFRGAKFIPAFRDGKPVACNVTLPVLYKARIF